MERSFLGRLLLVLCTGSPACLVREAPVDAPPPTAVHEMRRTYYPPDKQVVRWEARVLVWSDGREERDGPEREFSATGVLQEERSFDHGKPVGWWRMWYPDGTPRSEVDFGTPGSNTPAISRFWHANGKRSAEGPTIAGVREGRWSFWSEAGILLSAGGYRQGRRDGAWTLYDERSAARAAGSYALDQRVGEWTLWDAQGVAHVKPALAAESEDADP